MVEGRIIYRTLKHPSGFQAKWFEIETVHDGLTHRSSDHAYKTEEEARAAAAEQCDHVDPVLYREEL